MVMTRSAMASVAAVDEAVSFAQQLARFHAVGSAPWQRAVTRWAQSRPEAAREQLQRAYRDAMRGEGDRRLLTDEVATLLEGAERAWRLLR